MHRKSYNSILFKRYYLVCKLSISETSLTARFRDEISRNAPSSYRELEMATLASSQNYTTTQDEDSYIILTLLRDYLTRRDPIFYQHLVRVSFRWFCGHHYCLDLARQNWFAARGPYDNIQKNCTYASLSILLNLTARTIQTRGSDWLTTSSLLPLYFRSSLSVGQSINKTPCSSVRLAVLKPPTLFVYGIRL